MFEVIVLGSGTSSGVPVLGFDYSDSFLANPKNHRTRPSILLSGPQGNLLVDCTTDMRTQLLREKIKMVDAAIITHTHADHIMGMDDLRSFCLRSKKDMPVYTMPRYAEDIRRIFPYAFGEFPEGIEVPRFDMTLCDLENEPVIQMSICGFDLTLFLVWHGHWPMMGIRCGNFAYVTDVKTMPETAWAQLEGLDVLILDAVRIKPHPNHIHFDEAVQWTERIGAKQTYFTHLGQDYDHDVTNASLPAYIQLAYDGLRIAI